MTQLSFAWPQRYEQPAAYWSFVSGGRVVWRHIGARCIDLSWPWWKPWKLEVS